MFRAAYEFSEKNQVRTARLLGTSRNVVRARLLQYGLLGASPRQADEATSVRVTPIGPRMKSRAKVKVRVGWQSFGVLPLLKATGALEEALLASGAEVEWLSYSAGMQVVDALAAGALDLGIVGEAPPIFAQAARIPVVYLAAEAAAPEGEALVVREQSPLRSIDDLRGKTIAITRGANVVYFVVRALEERLGWASGMSTCAPFRRPRGNLPSSAGPSTRGPSGIRCSRPSGRPRASCGTRADSPRTAPFTSGGAPSPIRIPTSSTSSSNSSGRSVAGRTRAGGRRSACWRPTSTCQRRRSSRSLREPRSTFVR